MDSPFFKPAAIAAASCTVVQAIGWTVMSLLGILTATEQLGPKELIDVRDYGIGDVLGVEILVCYFPRKNFDYCCTNELILRGYPMLIISSIYLVGSLLWLCFSSLLLYDVTQKEKDTVKYTMMWAGLTINISVLDFIIVILFGIDYNKITVACEIDDAPILSVPGLLMTLAARGYVLWLMNVVAASFLLRYALEEPTIGHRSRRSSNSSGSTVYQSPGGGLQESRSMVFQNGDRPWTTQGGLSNSGSAPQLPPWERPDPSARSPSSQQQLNPMSYSDRDIKRGGLAQRMSMSSPPRGPAPQPPGYQPQPSYQQHPNSQLPQRASPSPIRPTATGAVIPEPDYGPTNLPPPGRSALKRSPSNAAPSPGDWRQPNPQQSGRDWSSQPQTPMTPGPITPDGRGGWTPATNADNRWGGYDNRGYDDGRWGRTGF